MTGDDVAPYVHPAAVADAVGAVDVAAAVGRGDADDAVAVAAAAAVVAAAADGGDAAALLADTDSSPAAADPVRGVSASGRRPVASGPAYTAHSARAGQRPALALGTHRERPPSAVDGDGVAVVPARVQGGVAVEDADGLDGERTVRGLLLPLLPPDAVEPCAVGPVRDGTRLPSGRVRPGWLLA